MASTIVKHSKRTLRRGCDLCGTKDLYLAHDTSRYGEHCGECEVSGPFVVVDLDGETPHALTCPGGTDSDDTWDETPVPGPEMPREAPKPAAPVQSAGHTPDAALAALQALMATLTPSVPRDEIVQIIKDEFNATVFPTRTVVVRDDVRKEVNGTTHPKLADVITDLMAGEHVMMVGPAGTGKSTLAEQAAEGLGLTFYSISLSPQTPASQLLGYMNATGDYVRSQYREAFEHGGVFLFDEIDNGHPSILAVMNAGLANGVMAFPDGMVKRHDDFRAVASANTYGKGADRKYVGRQAIDAATLDRFAIETIGYDEALESDLAHATGADNATVSKVLTMVRRYRATAEAKGMNVVMGLRASVGMCRLLAAGRDWDGALEARIRRGMSDADWNKLTNG